jgi:hypothetical protein
VAVRQNYKDVVMRYLITYLPNDSAQMRQLAFNLYERLSMVKSSTSNSNPEPALPTFALRETENMKQLSQSGSRWVLRYALDSHDGISKLSLYDALSPSSLPVSLSFISGNNHEKLMNRSYNKQSTLIRAVTLKGVSNEKVNVFDATGGFGEDSFALASLGFNVTMSER